MPDAALPKSPIQPKRYFSQTERYFIEQYHAATLQGAIERAAYQQRLRLVQTERSEDTPGFEGWRNLPINADLCDLPVDVDRIAEQIGIRIIMDQSYLGRADGRLLPVPGGFCVQLKEPVSKVRKRFTLAHEIGHTLFYSREGSWPEHQISRTSEKEHMAEERICNLFAMALLMPASRLRQRMPTLPEMSLPILLDILQRAANQFKVSIVPLVGRLCQLQPRSAPYLILQLKFKENKKSGTDPQLRLQRYFRFGAAKDWTIWDNRSARGIGLLSTIPLFEAWKSWQTEPRKAVGGRYIWTEITGLQQAGPHLDYAVVEDVNIGVRRQGKWKQATIPVRAASCLFAPPGATAQDAYILAVITPYPGTP